MPDEGKNTSQSSQAETQGQGQQPQRSTQGQGQQPQQPSLTQLLQGRDKDIEGTANFNDDPPRK